MIKIIFIIVGLIVIGVTYWLVSPLLTKKIVQESIEDIMKEMKPVETKNEPKAKVEPSPEPSMPSLTVAAEGKFTDADSFHMAEGTAKLLKVGDRYFVRFENNFKVTNGPDLFVIFGKDGQYNDAARLGALKGNIGSQNYEVPTSLNPNDYNEIWIWCRAFNVPFGRAELK